MTIRTPLSRFAELPRAVICLQSISSVKSWLVRVYTLRLRGTLLGMAHGSSERVPVEDLVSSEKICVLAALENLRQEYEHGRRCGRRGGMSR